MRLISNNNVLCTTTTWKNETNIDAGFAKTVDWLRSHLDQYRPDRYAV